MCFHVALSKEITYCFFTHFGVKKFLKSNFTYIFNFQKKRRKSYKILQPFGHEPNSDSFFTSLKYSPHYYQVLACAQTLATGEERILSFLSSIVTKVFTQANTYSPNDEYSNVWSCFWSGRYSKVNISTSNINYKQIWLGIDRREFHHCKISFMALKIIWYFCMNDSVNFYLVYLAHCWIYQFFLSIGT